MNPHYLGKLVMVGMNKKNIKPPVQAIKELFYRKFGKFGKNEDKNEPSSDDE